MTDTPEKVLSSMIGVQLTDIQNAINALQKQGYRVNKIRKKDGGYRTTFIPPIQLLLVQRKIKTFLVRSFQEWSRGLYGTYKNTSYVDHVRTHSTDRYFFHIDLKNAFPSAQTEIIKPLIYEKFFERTNNKVLSKRMVNLFYDLTTLPGLFRVLPQGTPTAPFLFYLVLGKSGLVNKISSIRGNLNVTVYVDNILVSSRNSINTIIQENIQEKVVSCGFCINNKKTAYYDKFYYQPIINGLRVADERVVLPKKQLRKLRGLIHRALYNPKLIPQAKGIIASLRPIYGGIPPQLMNSHLKLSFRDKRAQ